MALKEIKFGAGANLDVDPTTVKSGLVTLINAYADRGDAIRTTPGHTLYATIVDAVGDNIDVHTYYSKNFGVVIIVCAGRIFKQASYQGVVQEITGAFLDATARPSFTEDSDDIFICANSAIYKINPTGTTAETLGALVDEETSTVEIGVAVNEEGAAPNPRLLTLVSDGAKAIYYTVDGSTPNTTKTLYTLGTKISIESSLTFKCIAYDGNDVASEMQTREYIVEPTDVVNPQLKSFTVGTVENNSVIITKAFAVDKVGVTGYCITEDTETAPALNDPKWLPSYNNVKYYSRTATAGTRTLRAWARDAAGNVDTNVILPEVAFLAAITTPDDFSFTDVENTARDRYIESEAITLQGLTFQTTLSIADGEYAISKNGGAAWTNWRTASGTYDVGDVVKVRHRSASTVETDTVTTLTVGGVDGTFTSTTAVSQIPREAKQVAYLDGFLLTIAQPAEGSSVAGDILYSDDKDNNYAAWEVYNNESNPDKVQSLLVAFDRVYNIGLQTTEVTINDGTTPWAVNRNAFQEYGTMSPNSVAFDSESIYYLTEIAGARKIVQLRHGATPKIVSLPLDVPLEKMESLADASGFTMAFRGQNFYVLNLPSANTVIDDQQWDGITLAYHLQKESWIVLGKYNSDESVYTNYRGCSASYIEPWGVTLIGGRNGKLYAIYEDESITYANPEATEYTGPALTHRWRNDQKTSPYGGWSKKRVIKLGFAGDTRIPPDQYQCGEYDRCRQHELTYTDLTDAGEMHRAVIKSGHIDHGRPVGKIAAYYRYDVKRGGNGLILNGLWENVIFKGR